MISHPQRWLVVGFLLLLPLSALILLMDSFSSAQAYPPPTIPEPYPYPAGYTPATPTPPVYIPSPPGLTLAYSTYHPFLPQPPSDLIPVQFSLAGADTEEAAFLTAPQHRPTRPLQMERHPQRRQHHPNVPPLSW